MLLRRPYRAINDLTATDKLWSSIQNGREDEMVNYISQGADINKPNIKGETPLAYLAARANTDCITLLLKYGADICKRAMNGKTPLSIAAERGDLQMVKFLVERGAKPTIQTSFLDAIESKKLEIVKYMKKQGALVNWSYKNGSSPLSKAIEVGDVFIVNYLIEDGADPKLISEEKKHSLLMLHVEKKNSKIVELLVDLGVNLETIAQCGYTALTKAVELEDFLTVKVLVEKGASVNQPKSDGKTALSIAASLNHFQIATFLIDSGANIKLAQAEVEQYATWNEDFEIFLKLFQKCSISVMGSEHEEAESVE